jgi:hypothetical protein
VVKFKCAAGIIYGFSSPGIVSSLNQGSIFGMSKREIIVGDGIGPEITAAVIKVIEASGAEITWIEHVAGLAALEKGLDVLRTRPSKYKGTRSR